MKTIKRIDVFTDGACRGNPGPGGWAAILRYNAHEKRISGAERETTNNRMELLAAIRALESLRVPCEVHLTTDAQYVRQGITVWIKKWQENGWKTSGRQEVKNVDLWQRLAEITAKHNVHWHWVKGHAGHPENELADQLANEAVDRLLQS